MLITPGIPPGAFWAGFAGDSWGLAAGASGEGGCWFEAGPEAGAGSEAGAGAGSEAGADVGGSAAGAGAAGASVAIKILVWRLKQGYYLGVVMLDLTF